MPPARQRATFAGITFNGFVRKHYPERVTVPVPNFRMILRSGRVKVVCDYEQTDDYSQDAERNFKRGVEMEPRDAENQLDVGKPDKLYLDLEKNTIRFQPSQNVSFTVTEVDVEGTKE